MAVILFEDDAVRQLYPITVGRPAMAIGCGSYRLLDLAGRLGGPLRAIVRPHLRPIIEADYPALVGDLNHDPRGAVLLNARAVPSVEAVARLDRLVREGRYGVVRAERALVAAVLPPGTAIPERESDWPAWLERLAFEPLELDWPLLEYPHDVVRYHPLILPANLEDRLKHGQYREVADGVFAHPSAKLGAYGVTDTRKGPVLLEEGAEIGPYCLLRGPVHVAEHARVIEYAALKDAVAIGHTAKIGGEVEGSVIESYTNKQHHGFLGHSYLGSWINLGAGTCNSDLKNTYGPVTMEYHGRRVATGMQFLGCMVGDYAKSAINTGFFTGKTVGVCSMLYGFVTTNVASFVNYARSFGQVTEAPVEVMVATQARMFQRRGVEQRPCDIQLLHDMFELTWHERRLAEEPLSL